MRPENAIRSEDGALTTTMVAILAEREVEVSPIEATAFALGIHEDTGSLGYAGTTVRDAEALAWCMRHGASQEMVAQYLHTPLAERERALLDALVAGLEPHEAGGYEVLVAGLRWPEYVEGVSNLAHKIVDLTDCRALVCLVEMDGRVFCVVRTRVAELDAVGDRRGPGRRRPFAGGVRDLPGLPRGRARRGARGAPERGAPRPDRGRDHVAAGPLRLPGRHRRARDGPVPAPPPERDARRRARPAGRRGHA